MINTYPRIHKMMGGYINMDASDITGHCDYEGQIRYYMSRVSPKALSELLTELECFEAEHRPNLSADFDKAFDYGADIEDVAHFFALIRQLVGHKQVSGVRPPQRLTRNPWPLQ
ncbi:contact-dependent growth inhibition system immunity protein [Erwinia sp. V71]|uniref:contact-dependent growth inhibition system immunity protein n=1 Tax=Erwinia sp. V71 TaxID=3369424 RepID=UPI003F62CBA4